MSGAASRRKGNRWELDVCQLLIQHGWQAVTSRAARGGTQAGADIITDAPIIVEAKNHKQMNLSGWLDQAVAQADDTAPAALFIKRRQKPSGDCYVVMRADDYLALIRGDYDAEDAP